MERCPNCRARSSGTPCCRRCGMELHWLEQIEQAAQQKFSAGLNAMLAGHWSLAAACLREAQALQQQPLAAELLGFIDSIIVMEPSPEPSDSDDAATVDRAADATTGVATTWVAPAVPPQTVPPAIETRWLLW